MRRKVSGRNGKRSAFPDHQERRPQTQNKKRKSNYEKSKHSVQTNNRGSDPASPRLLAAVFISAPIPAAAATRWCRLTALVSGYIDTSESLARRATIHDTRSISETRPISEPTPGPAESASQDVCNSTYIGTFHWFAENGDEIYGTFGGYLTPTGTPGVYDNHETADVTGGTGRFSRRHRPLRDVGRASRTSPRSRYLCYPLAKDWIIRSSATD